MKIYEKVYNYYLNLIECGSLKANDKLPSIKESTRILSVSRTSVETAYFQLAADGYVYSVEKVGFFISDSPLITNRMQKEPHNINESYSSDNSVSPIAYPGIDLATIREDPLVSCLDLWRRYMKSALRQEDRLLSYASPQGEEDLRQEICKYVRKNRNIICSADNIVIGAGFVNLLHTLIPLLSQKRTVSFPTKNFQDGAMAFETAGFEVTYRNKNAEIIYVTPAYMTKWGEIMTIKRRREIIAHAQNNNHLLIEDDYQNDFVFSNKATPSLYALSQGKNVTFIGSFSRALLPSVRISFMILPDDLKESYVNKRNLFNQVASKAEQIALTQFLRDGQLERHIKKMRRLYDEKRHALINELKKELDSNNKLDLVNLFIGESGMEIGLMVPFSGLFNYAKDNDLLLIPIDENERQSTCLISVSGIDANIIPKAVKKLCQVIVEHC